MRGPTADRPRGPLPDRAGEPGPVSASGEGPPGRAGVALRPGTPGDAARVATLHAEGIDEGFLPLLGPDFLRRLYGRICRHRASFLLVAEDADRRDEDIVGFIAGSTDLSGLYRSFVVRDGPAAVAHALGPVLRGWRRVLETVRHGSPGGRSSDEAELLAVAVDPRWQGRGTARRLVASFLDEVGARGYRAAQVVVGAGNRPAVALYEQAGFRTTDRFELHPGTESLLMRWESSGPPAPPRGVAG